MPEFITYLLKVNTTLFLFYLAYLLIFRRLTFYNLNRAFLLFGILFSLLFPLINLSGIFHESTELASLLLPEAIDWELAGVPKQTTAISNWQWANYFFMITALGMGVRFLIQLSSLLHIHRQSVPATYKSYRYRQINQSISPFSFWQSIYLNVEDHNEEDLDIIFRHEQLHISGWHSLDILLVQALSTITWFNPACWFLQKAVAETLEFSTDQKMLLSGINQKKYQYSLISMEYPQLLPSLVNNFNFLTTKKRIAMMNKKQSSSIQLANYAILPFLIVIFTFAFSATQAQVQTSAFTLRGEAEGGKNIEVTSTSSSQDTLIYYVDGKRVSDSEAKQLNPNNIEKMEVIKGERAISLSGNKSIKGILKITTKDGMEAEKGKSPEGASLESSSETETIEQNKHILQIKGTEYEHALILLNGEQIAYNELKSLNPEQIKTIEVLKGENAREVYGDKGAQGVIKISTK